MMKCTDVRELIGLYWDLPENDLRRTAVDEHVRKCRACAEEFKLWQESAQLIYHAGSEDMDTAPSSSVSTSVMNRIYADESWRQPVAERAYSLTRRFTMRLSACIAVCLTLFITGFIYTVLNHNEEPEVYTFRPGVVPVISAHDSNDYQAAIFSQEIPTASVTAPIILDAGPVDSYPNYLVVISILGVVISLLIMNWLSRLKA